MRCEECLPLIEEYVDGELDGRILERLAAHLSTCAVCASELAVLRREQEIYAHYRRDIEITPAQWNIVQARIEQEKDARLQKPRTRRRAWLGELIGSGREFRPAFVAALVLIVIGITAGIIFLSSGNRPPEIVLQAPKQTETRTPAGVEQGSPSESNQKSETPPGERNEKESNANRRTQVAATGASGAAGQKKTTVVARLPRSEKPGVKQPTPDESAQLVEAVADRESTITGVRRSAPEETGDFDFEIARHTKRAELLLRSFRNVRPPAVARRALDVSYEKEQSRRLLYQNIALRRNAVARGDQPAAELLNTLEPLLLDIANLPNRARPRDVRSIERRMEKKEIVATLQVRTLVAAN